MLSYSIIRPFLLFTKSLNLATLDFSRVAEQTERNDNAVESNFNEGYSEEDVTKTQYQVAT